MRGGLKTLAVVALVALLIVVGLAACGGSDSDSSTTTAADQGRTEGRSAQGSSEQSGAEGDEGKSGGGEGQSGPSASEFTPKDHSDSGGGSEQVKVKGGDNSIQEFGEEADTSEFDAAAATLHNFLDARAEGNWAAACDYMSKAMLESFEELASQAKKGGELSCGALLETLVNPAARSAMKAEAEKADVRSLRTEGERAFVIYTGAEGAILAMPMASEGGEWKVASLTGTPLN